MMMTIMLMAFCVNQILFLVILHKLLKSIEETLKIKSHKAEDSLHDSIEPLLIQSERLEKKIYELHLAAKQNEKILKDFQILLALSEAEVISKTELTKKKK